MKTSIKFFAAFAFILTAAACSKIDSAIDSANTEGQTVRIKIHGTSVQTKTGVEYDANYKAHFPFWNNGDELAVIFDSFKGGKGPDAVIANIAEDKSTEADFFSESVTLKNGAKLLEEGTVYSVYPASKVQDGSSNASDKTLRIDLKPKQTPAGVGTFDPEADILLGRPSDYLYYEDEGLLSEIAFSRVMSVVKVSLVAGEGCPSSLKVKEFKMTAPDNYVLAGRVTLCLDEINNESPLKDWTIKEKAVSAVYSGDFHPVIGGDENTVYLVVNPVSITSGAVEFDIDTDEYTIHKTVALNGAISFPQGNVANITLSISGANCTVKSTETRILVENFDGVSTNKTQAEPAVTGATGTGVSDDLSYTYSTTNTNIRINSNGQSSSNPYLYVSGANESLVMQNIVIDHETSLKFSCKSWTSSGSANLVIKYKSSDSDTWSAGQTIPVKLNDKTTIHTTVFSIPVATTSLDIQIMGSAALLVDDVVLESNVVEVTTLDKPANILASLDTKTSNTISVSWSAVSNADKYEVAFIANGQDDIVKYSTTNSLVATGLAYNTEYTIKVKAQSNDTEHYADSDYTTAENTVTTGDEPDPGNLDLNGDPTLALSGFSFTAGLDVDLETEDDNIELSAHKGSSGTNPANYNDGIRLYQGSSGNAGGYIIIEAKNNKKIKQLKITSTGTYSTTIKSKVGDSGSLSDGISIAKSSEITIPGIDTTDGASKVYVYNYGQDKDSRLEIASIKVWYE